MFFVAFGATILLACLVGVALLGRAADSTSYEGTETEFERERRLDAKERRESREVEFGPSAPGVGGRGAQEAEHARQVEMANEIRESRLLTRVESEEIRDELIVSLATVSGLNLTGPKGKTLIRHGKALPTSVLETFDRGRELFCELKGLGSHYDLALRLQLTTESHVHLRLRRSRAVPVEQFRWTKDLETGDKRFDRAYMIEGKGFLSVQPLQELVEAREAVDRVFALPGVTSLTIRGGLLRVDGELDAEEDRADLGALLGGLRVLASIYEGEAPALVELRTRLVAGSGGLCPYCRDTFDEELEVIECEGCGTSLHEECHTENGGCPVLGCGVAGTRARQLA